MAGGVNKAILIGRAGQDPTTRNTQAGAKVVSFSLATSEQWTDKDSRERREETVWHNIVVFNPRLADVAEKFVRKGLQVYVEGAIKNRRYTGSDGIERAISEIVLANFAGALTVLTPRDDPTRGAPAREYDRDGA